MNITTKQEDLKNIIVNLVEKAKDFTIDETINYLKSVFPINEYKWENINTLSDFYIEHRDTIDLSMSNQTQLIINYPGGDRLGDKISDPYYNIYFYNPILEKNNDFNRDMYLFYKDKYNSENRILQNIDAFTEDYRMTANEIIFVLDDCLRFVPLNILAQVDNMHLKDPLVVQAIIDCVSRVSKFNVMDAYDQYMYGQYGGADVPIGQLSLSSQFYKQWEALPDLIKMVCHEELENTWLLLLDTLEPIFAKEKKLMEVNTMINDIVQNWIDELTEKHGVNELKYIPEDVLLEEIEEAKGTIENCKIWDDQFGIACNEYYVERLEVARVKTKSFQAEPMKISSVDALISKAKEKQQSSAVLNKGKEIEHEK